jgi:DNA-binding NarL/FixJ family response regulator
MESTTSLLHSANPICVLVADATRMGSQLLGDALGRAKQFEIAGPVASSADLLRVAAVRRPDVVVLSPHLDDERDKGFSTARQLRASYPEIRVIVVVDTSTRDVVLEAFRVGARGVFCRSDSIDDLCKCINVVHSGQIWASTAELEFVMQALGKSLPSRLVNSNGIALLSKREQDVIRSLSEGLTNREIAAELKLSEHTVKNYLLRIFDKLGVSNRAEAILYAFSQSGPVRGNGAGEARGALPEHPAARFECFRKAADAGDGFAQYIVGQMYRDGYGVTENKVFAYMWFLLSETTAGYIGASTREAKEQLAATMTPDQILEAQRQASAWVNQQLGASLGIVPGTQAVSAGSRRAKPLRSFPSNRAGTFRVHSPDQHPPGSLANVRK